MSYKEIKVLLVGEQCSCLGKATVVGAILTMKMGNKVTGGGSAGCCRSVTPIHHSSARGGDCWLLDFGYSVRTQSHGVHMQYTMVYDHVNHMWPNSLQCRLGNTTKNRFLDKDRSRKHGSREGRLVRLLVYYP
jgi:hypothetical protein